MIVIVATPCVVSDPAIVFRMHVWGFGVAWLIVELPVLIFRRGRSSGGSTHWRWTMNGYVTIPNAMFSTRLAPVALFTVLLGEHGNTDEQSQG